MDSASTTPAGRKQSDSAPVAEERAVQVVCRLTPTEHRRFQIAAERHGAGDMAGQMRVLIREWMRSLNQPDLDDINQVAA